jgi:hypothetical protein
VRAARIAWPAALALAACARPGPPPGGPPDTTPPEIVSISPDDGAVGVPRDAPLLIRFSEKVDAKSLERALWITPGGASKPRFDVSGQDVTIRTAAGFPESTTVGVLLTTQIRDRKRDTEQNPLREPVRWVFSTGDSVWPGVVRGSVERPGEKAGQGQGPPARSTGTVLVVMYPASLDSIPDLALVPPLAVTEPDSAGRFILAGLPVTGERVRLVPVYDRDGNRAISGRGEYASAESETLVVSGHGPQDVALRLVDPAAPGTLTGTLGRAEGDTVRAGIELFTPGPADTATAAVKRGAVNADGSFTMGGVAPGPYRVTAFCDPNGNGRHDPGEAVTELGQVTIRPGATFTMEPIPMPDCSQSRKP